MPKDASPSALMPGWARYEVAVHTLAHVAIRLQEAGVPVVPVKGIVLARWFYDDVGERTFADVDLLVRRSDFAAACNALDPWGTPAWHSMELGEISTSVDGVTVELHAEMGRRELTDLSVSEVLERATLDTETFTFPILRLDDVDHLFLVALNAIKDGFVFSLPHIPGDLERLLARVDPFDVVRRARDEGFATGLYCTAEWMKEEHGSTRWSELMAILGPPRRRLQAAAFRAFWRSRRLPRMLGVGLACLNHDRVSPRSHALGRIVRRYAGRLAGRALP